MWSSGAQSGAIDTIIYIFQQTENGIEYIDFIDQGQGESYNFFVAETGTYYLGLLGYDDSQQGLCQIEINSTAPEQTLTLEEGFGALDTTTTLPYSGQYDLGSEPILYNCFGNLTYGTLFRVEAEANTRFDLSFWSANGGD